MKYGEYKTLYETETAARGIRIGVVPVTEFYKMAVSATKEAPADIRHMAQIGMVAEGEWLLSAKPYYKFAPDLLQASLDARLDVPTELLKFPHTAFAINLPLAGRRLSYHNIEVQANIDALLLYDATDMHVRVPGQRMLSIAPAGGAITPGIHQFTFVLYDGQTIQQSLESHLGVAGTQESDTPLTHEERSRGEQLSRDLLCLSLSACLFATVAMRFLLRDVLARDRDKFDRLPLGSPEREAIEERAARYGRGWEITTRHLRGRELPLDREVDGSSDPSTPAGRELQFSHIRGAHWHRYPTAQDPKNRVQFLMPCLVRPDLPTGADA